ncbi:MAG: P-loop NTPase [Gemmatimonadota bacterium]|nr:P-loop NTPase [Gemmatimonadota bacterium]
MPLEIRTYNELEGGADLGDQVARQQQRVDHRLESIAAVIAVMSGKGGVGKSLVTAALATALASSGRRVGVVDADLNGPSLVRLLGVEPEALPTSGGSVEPARTIDGIALMSMGLLVRDGEALGWREPEGAGFVWRGAQERGALREFLADVAWGELDLLLVDLPPGTGRLVELHEMVPDLAGTVAVTIPTPASGDAVARSIELSRRRGIEVVGIVSNMEGARCGACGVIGPLHSGSAADELAERFDAPVIARIPLDPALGRAADEGALGRWLAGTDDTRARIVELAETVGRVVDAARRAGRSA